MTEASIENAAFYEWLLSDHPDARAERGRRRAATYQDECERTGKVLAWVSKINATPDAPGTLRDLAESMGSLAANAAARAEAEFATSDEAYVAGARANWETYMQVSAPDGSWDYRYPDRYTARVPPTSRGRTSGRTPPWAKTAALGLRRHGTNRKSAANRSSSIRKEQGGMGKTKDPICR